jgi:Translocation protein Sec62
LQISLHGGFLVNALERTSDDTKQKSKFRFPQELVLARELAENNKGFIFFPTAQEKKSSKVFAFLITIAISAILLIRLWPRILQLGVLYTSVTLLYSILGLIVLRLLVFFPLRFLGIELWIFPNLFGDCSPLESFLPVISCNRSHDPWLAVLIRSLLLIALLGCLGFYWFDFNSMVKGKKDLNFKTVSLFWVEYGWMGLSSYNQMVDYGKSWLEGANSNGTVLYGQGPGGAGRRRAYYDTLNEDDDIIPDVGF